jgi:hypothetical protein
MGAGLVYIGAGKYISGEEYEAQERRKFREAVNAAPPEEAMKILEENDDWVTEPLVVSVLARIHNVTPQEIRQHGIEAVAQREAEAPSVDEQLSKIDFWQEDAPWEAEISEHARNEYEDHREFWPDDAGQMGTREDAGWAKKEVK